MNTPLRDELLVDASGARDTAITKARRAADILATGTTEREHLIEASRALRSAETAIVTLGNILVVLAKEERHARRAKRKAAPKKKTSRRKR